MLDKHVSFGWGEPVHSDEDGHREEFAVTRARSQRKIERAREAQVVDETITDLVPNMTPDEFRAHMATKIRQQALREVPAEGVLDLALNEDDEWNLQMKERDDA